MSLTPEVEAARSRLFELIGRNVLRYQHLELLLKQLVAHSDLDFKESDVETWKLPDFLAQKTTMGIITKAFFGQVVTTEPKESLPKETNPDSLRFRLRMHLPVGEEDHQAWVKRMARLISTRNELIHHSLTRMKIDTVDGCLAACEELELQGAEIAKETSTLQSIAKNWLELKSETLRRLSFELEQANGDTSTGPTRQQE